MSLFDVTEVGSGTTYQKPVYFKNTVGNHIIRVLPAKYTKVWAHYLTMARAMVVCPGRDECPICEQNVKIRAEYPADYSKHGYLGLSQRFCVNVYDRTPTIVCSQCQTENIATLTGKFNPVCSNCGNSLITLKPAPLNKVKLLSGGPEFFNLLNGYDDSVLDESGEPLGLGNFDIQIMCMPDKNNRVKGTPIPLSNQRDVLEISEDDLYDTELAVLKFTPAEILELQHGVKIRDIFLARKSVVETTDPTQEEQETAEDAVNSLFNA